MTSSESAIDSSSNSKIMSKNSNLATKYEKDDPDFTGPSTTDQSVRNLPKRTAKANINQIIESSSSENEEEKDDSFTSLNNTFIHSILEEKDSEMGTVSVDVVKEILQQVLLSLPRHQSSLLVQGS